MLRPDAADVSHAMKPTTLFDVLNEAKVEMNADLYAWAASIAPWSAIAGAANCCVASAAPDQPKPAETSHTI